MGAERCATVFVLSLGDIRKIKHCRNDVLGMNQEMTLSALLNFRIFL